MAIPISSSLKLFGGVTSALAGAYGGWHFYDRGIGGYGGWRNRKAPVQDQEKPQPSAEVQEQKNPALPNPKVVQKAVEEQPDVPNRGESGQDPQVQNGLQPQAQEQAERPGEVVQNGVRDGGAPQPQVQNDHQQQQPLEQRAEPNGEIIQPQPQLQPPGPEVPRPKGDNRGGIPGRVEGGGKNAFKNDEHKDNFSGLVHVISEHIGKLEKIKNFSDGNDAGPIKDAMVKTMSDLDDDYYKDKLQINKDAWKGLIGLLQKIINKGSTNDESGYYQKFNSDMENIKNKFTYFLPPQLIRAPQE